MGDILIKNLDDVFVSRLKQCAQQQGLSPEESARRFLIDALRPSRDEIIADLNRIAAMNPPITEPPFSEDFIREDRDAR
ncbi:MAG: hypothetical protein WDN01_11640 [Rhizomicrobium sp.]